MVSERGGLSRSTPCRLSDPRIRNVRAPPASARSSSGISIVARPWSGATMSSTSRITATATAVAVRHTISSEASAPRSTILRPTRGGFS
jgi:hypothetical protein